MSKKLYAGQKKVSDEIEKRLKAEQNKDFEKINKQKKIYYYANILNKNKKNGNNIR